MHMMLENEEIKLKGEDLIFVIQEIDLILGSLHRIGSYFGERDYEGVDKQKYDSETNRFLDEWRVTRRLARVRTILSEKFDTTLGDDELDDLERATGDIRYWRSPDSRPEE